MFAGLIVVASVAGLTGPEAGLAGSVAGLAGSVAGLAVESLIGAARGGIPAMVVVLDVGESLAVCNNVRERERIYFD